MQYSSTKKSNRLEIIRSWLNQKPLNEKSGKWYFRYVDNKTETTDSFDRIKLLFKNYPRFYYLLIEIISPVYSDRRSLKKFITLAEKPILNLGSGNQPKLANTINIDMMDYENVDIVADIMHLPFCDSTVNAVMSLAVLEHVKEPSVVLKEIYRVLKPGGLVLSVVPFMQPFHASPHDYQRYTLTGIEYLHRDFEILESGVYSGPISGFLWVLQETLASTFSFGLPTLRNLLYIFLILVTWPIKFLDILFINLSTSKNVASNFYVIARKV
jgi:SAM-dependent methyltransferase